MGYCDVEDLHISDGVLLPSSLDLESEVDQAANDMDALLGFIYALPLNPLKPHEVKLLNLINSKIASGRILLMLYGEGEGEALHAYGLRLLAEGESMLMKLANGEVDLAAERVNPEPLDTFRGPAIKNRDAESAVDMFENAVFRGEPSFWVPGDAPKVL